METISWLVAKSVQLARGTRVRWTLYRKLRRCKRQTDNLRSPTASRQKKNHQIINANCKKLCENKSKDGKQMFANRNKIFSDYYPHLRTRSSDTSHVMGPNDEKVTTKISHTRNLETDFSGNVKCGKRNTSRGAYSSSSLHRKETSLLGRLCIVLTLFCFINEFSSSSIHEQHFRAGSSQATSKPLFSPLFTADASLIIGDSAIEIQEVSEPPNTSSTPTSNDGANNNHQQQSHLQPAEPGSYSEQPSLILGSTQGATSTTADSPIGSHQNNIQAAPAGSSQQTSQLDTPKEIQHPSQAVKRPSPSGPAGPLPPLAGSGDSAAPSSNRRPEESAEDDKSKPQRNHDYDLNDGPDEKAITGKVVDFELTPAGGHNKAKIKKKKKKKKKKEEEEFKKWGKKKKSEKKASEKKHKESMKKKKEEGKKGKKKWGVEEHGQKKKGKFKKKKWGKKVKKGKGVKKGKKGKKFLKDKGHKNTGFKTVYHKEEWGKSSKWHDIKREKKWDEKSKKWKKKWKKEKGKKYKGDHMKKFEKKKKSGKKYKKEKKEKFKKSKKEEFKKGKKEKMEESGKKKEGGSKKEMKEEKKKMKKKKKKG